MRNGVNVFRVFTAAATILASFSGEAAAEGPAPPIIQAGENRWVPSLAITGGALFQNQNGTSASFITPEGGETEVLRSEAQGSDLLVAPFVGASLELMAPALPVPARPRFFLGAEILPTFSSERNLTVDGDPGCIIDFRPGAPCARDEPVLEDFPETPIEEFRRNPNRFGESQANGRGSQTTSEIGTTTFGANLGVAFPFEFLERQLRIKPSVAWINYKVEATGLVKEANCNPGSTCTDLFRVNFFTGELELAPNGDGNLREIELTGSSSRRFNGIGGGLDLEVDTARFGPIGSSLFLGGRFHRVVGDRTITFSDTVSYDRLEGPEDVPPAVAEAQWTVEVKPWLYRAHVGIRFQWLGFHN